MQKSAAAEHIPKPLGDAEPYKPYVSKDTPGCYNAVQHDSAELCVQYRSTLAAERAADATITADYISGAAAFLSFISVVLVLLALKQGRDANRISESTAKQQLRAYVSVKETTVNIFQFPADSGNIDSYEFVINWQNTGSSPATNIRTGVNRIILGGELPPEHDYGKPDNSKPGTSIGPGQSIFSSIRIALADIVNPCFGGRLYVWSFIEYDDIFSPNTPRRRSEVCSEVVFGDATRLGAKIDLTHRGPFNGLDEDCHYQPC